MTGPLRRWVEGLRSRPAYLLPVGAALGLGLAASGAFAPNAAAPLNDAAALVNGVPIAKADHERVIEALAASKRNPLDTDDERFALSRLIDEELLIQRGVELGLHRSDPLARKRLVSAMIEWIAADTAYAPVSEDELRAFYEENAGLFTPTVRADVAWFRIARTEANGALRARQAEKRLADGLSFEEAAATFASPSALSIPDGLLPAAKLRDYLGPALTRTALALRPGEVAGPIARTDGWHFLWLRERETAEPPAFKSVRAQVKAEYKRMRTDKTVRAYLARLRRRAEIVMAGDGSR